LYNDKRDVKVEKFLIFALQNKFVRHPEKDTEKRMIQQYVCINKRHRMQKISTMCHLDLELVFLVN